jgi:hypothetical protein
MTEYRRTSYLLSLRFSPHHPLIQQPIGVLSDKVIHIVTSYTENRMARGILFASITVALLGIVSYKLGLFDRPDFEFHSSFLVGLNKDKAFHAVIATSTCKDIGGNVERLLRGTKAPLDVDNFKTYLSQAAQDYGAPSGAEAVAVGLYFDDPSSVEAPRWGIGWAVSAPIMKDLESLRDHVKSAFEGDEPIRLVGIGPGPILKARIPYRSILTPMIAPMLHWRRGFQKFLNGGFEADNGRSTGVYFNGHPSGMAAVACEVYVSGRNDIMEYIDYVVVMGDTQALWENSFPSEPVVTPNAVEEDDFRSQALVGEDENQAFNEDVTSDSVAARKM